MLSVLEAVIDGLEPGMRARPQAELWRSWCEYTKVAEDFPKVFY